MNYKQAVQRIGILEDKHPQREGICPGCDICDEIGKLSPIVKYSPKVGEILAKGEEMTKKEIFYLMEKEVLMNDIAQALNMTLDEFQEHWFQWTGSRADGKKKQAEPIQLTPEEYQAYKEKGYTDRKICAELGIHPPALSKWRKYRLAGEVEWSLTKEEYVAFKNEGKKDQEISKKLGIGFQTLCNWKKHHFTSQELSVLSLKKGQQSKTLQKNKKPVTDENKAVIDGLKRELKVREKAIKDLTLQLENVQAETVPHRTYQNLKVEYEDTLIEKQSLINENVKFHNEIFRLKELVEEKTQEAEKFRSSFEDAKRILEPLRTLSLEYLQS